MINAGAPLYRRNLISSRVELAGSRSGAKGGRNGDLANRRWRQIEWIALAREHRFFTGRVVGATADLSSADGGMGDLESWLLSRFRRLSRRSKSLSRDLYCDVY